MRAYPHLTLTLTLTPTPALTRSPAPTLTLTLSLALTLTLTRRVLAVPLPADCPLRAAQGVEYVIHAVAPNMHPNRPDCLDGDYETGCRQLAETYEHLFREFMATALHPPLGCTLSSEPSIPPA